MIDLLWKLMAVWSIYETGRAIIVYLLREEVRRIANTKSTCRRCQWRLFCTRAAYYLFTHTKPIKNVRARITVVLLPLVAGNGDALWLLLQKLLEERKAINVRRKEKSSVPGLRNGK